MNRCEEKLEDRAHTEMHLGVDPHARNRALLLALALKMAAA
ncbi:MAG: hypothetical protein OEN48_19165 [Betaproteobacteria bacterium]|nr:hypothetical protein [Betaproteobacteria bacterium]